MQKRGQRYGARPVVLSWRLGSTATVGETGTSMLYDAEITVFFLCYGKAQKINNGHISPDILRYFTGRELHAVLSVQ